ncbi:MAG: dTDP-glucose 4,6-dehydratase, partial [Candidatus Berkelbacteria bacterium Licking1014_85]
MKKNILITGGLGFIGSNFIRHLYNKYPDYSIWNFDLMTYAGNPDNLLDIEDLESKEENKRYFFIKGDICDSLKLNEIFNRIEFDFVVNFAAESHVDRSIINSDQFIRSNITGVHVLINILRHHNRTRFIQISTDEIYGDVPEKIKSNENYPIQPSNPYAASKAAADVLVQSYMKTFGLSAIIVRGANNFGFYQYPEKIIPLTITNLIQGIPVPIHGSGSQIRNWVHTNDFSEGLDIVMHNAPNSSIYNISGTEKSIIDVVKKIGEIMGKSGKKDLIVNVNDRPGRDMRYAPDSSKLTLEFGWKPKKSVDESLNEVIHWYLNNKKWWQDIMTKKRK